MALPTSARARYSTAPRRYLPGGVNSPVRAFRAVGGEPLVIDRGEGPYLYDVDGNRYIDYVCSWGPLILGHAYPAVVEAVQKAAERGTSYGAPTEVEAELARMVVEAMPSIEMVRFVNSGTEATMSALRLARAFTGRDKIVKFEGCYHGHADGLLVQAGSGVATLRPARQPGRARILRPRDAGRPLQRPRQRRRRCSSEHRDEIAAVIVEPVPGQHGRRAARRPASWQSLREMTERTGACSSSTRSSPASASPTAARSRSTASRPT